MVRESERHRDKNTVRVDRDVRDDDFGKERTHVRQMLAASALRSIGVSKHRGVGVAARRGIRDVVSKPIRHETLVPGDDRVAILVLMNLEAQSKRDDARNDEGEEHDEGDGDLGHLHDKERRHVEIVLDRASKLPQHRRDHRDAENHHQRERSVEQRPLQVVRVADVTFRLEQTVKDGRRVSERVLQHERRRGDERKDVCDESVREPMSPVITRRTA